MDTADLEASAGVSLERFSRQLILPGWSVSLQRRLAALEVVLPEEFSIAELYFRALGVERLSYSGESSVIIRAGGDGLEIAVSKDFSCVRANSVSGGFSSEIGSPGCLNREMCEASIPLLVVQWLRKKVIA